MLWKKARPLISSQVLSARKGVSTSVHGFFLIKFCRWRFSKLEFLHKRSSSAWQALTPWFSYAVVLPSPFRCQRRAAAAPSVTFLQSCAAWLECRAEGSSCSQAGHCSGTGECKRVTAAPLKNFVQCCRCPKPLNEQLFTVVTVLLYMQPELKNKNRNWNSSHPYCFIRTPTARFIFTQD